VNAGDAKIEPAASDRRTGRPAAAAIALVVDRLRSNERAQIYSSSSFLSALLEESAVTDIQ
jgi:hypothetical protein